MNKRCKTILKTLVFTTLIAVLGTHEVQEAINDNPPNTPAILFVGSAGQ